MMILHVRRQEASHATTSKDQKTHVTSKSRREENNQLNGKDYVADARRSDRCARTKAHR